MEQDSGATRAAAAAAQNFVDAAPAPWTAHTAPETSYVTSDLDDTADISETEELDRQPRRTRSRPPTNAYGAAYLDDVTIGGVGAHVSLWARSTCASPGCTAFWSAARAFVCCTACRVPRHGYVPTFDGTGQGQVHAQHAGQSRKFVVELGALVAAVVLFLFMSGFVLAAFTIALSAKSQIEVGEHPLEHTTFCFDLTDSEGISRCGGKLAVDLDHELLVLELDCQVTFGLTELVALYGPVNGIRAVTDATPTTALFMGVETRGVTTTNTTQAAAHGLLVGIVAHQTDYILSVETTVHQTGRARGVLGGKCVPPDWYPGDAASVDGSTASLSGRSVTPRTLALLAGAALAVLHLSYADWD